jgi:hypothetical protein
LSFSTTPQIPQTHCFTEAQEPMWSDPPPLSTHQSNKSKMAAWGPPLGDGSPFLHHKPRLSLPPPVLDLPSTELMASGRPHCPPRAGC